MRETPGAFFVEGAASARALRARPPPRTWSSCVRQVNCDLGMLGAKCDVMSALVLAGLPTTSTCARKGRGAKGTGGEQGGFRFGQGRQQARPGLGPPREPRSAVTLLLFGPHLDRLLGLAVEAVALALENLGVLRQQVLALHALAARDGANKNGNVAVLERHLRVRGRHNLWRSVAGSRREAMRGPMDDGKGAGGPQRGRAAHL